jgi:superfamily II DNA/RNA helicase
LQAAYLVYDGQKIDLVKKLLTGKDLPSILIFSATKSGVKELERELLRQKFNVKAIHSDLEQDQRKEVLREFKNREVQILVATDIVSRGIDIDNISLVINYNVPQDAEDYVHRVGRTARADKTGVAITLINEKETWNFKKIEKLIETEVKKLPLPEGFAKGPEMDQKRPSYGKSTFKGGKGRGKGGFKRTPRKG